MEIFERFLAQVAAVPDWAVLLLPPALLLAAALLFLVFGGRRAYLPVCIAIGAAGFFLVGCKTDRAPLYLALYVLEGALLRLLFFLPIGKKEHDLYGKFALPLEEPALPAEFPPQEDGPVLTHAFALLEALKGCELSAGDRLETDALSGTLEDLRGKALTEDDRRALNDCLATILKFTAKYKL